MQCPLFTTTELCVYDPFGLVILLRLSVHANPVTCTTRGNDMASKLAVGQTLFIYGTGVNLKLLPHG